MKREKSTKAALRQFSFRPQMVQGSNAVSTKEVRRSSKRSHAFRPHLEKIGGMERDVKKYVSEFCQINAPGTFVMRTSISESINHLPNNANTIINLKRINDVRGINKFLHNVNDHLVDGGLFVGCVETKYLRKTRIFNKFPKGLAHIYYVLDFFLKRVFPKFPITRLFYNVLVGERNKVLSRTETLGRLYAAGFEIRSMKFIGKNLYFVASKVKEPLFDYEPVYGPIFRMRRHGKNGKVIYVYKMRTMHSYSEYIQKYVYDTNNLADGGKMNNDFRVSTLGRLFRRYWIDELPMIMNLIKGDLKIVGVRPLSSHYLGLYSEELQERRLKHKPGLVPPFYVDMPKTIEEIQASEMRYLQAYEKSPFVTDVKYFCLAAYNILLKKARSK
ncbi:MAG: sugar transferase [Bacteroidetes bacterium]|nr:sugar transferase [Bacteroidota bacterium]